MDGTSPKGIDAVPAPDQLIEHNGTSYTTIKEGLAHILVPPNAKTSTNPKVKEEESEQSQNVFYNPIQQFNRDLSVLAIKAFGEDMVERRRLKAEKKSQATMLKKERKRQYERNGDEEAKRRKGNDGAALSGGEKEEAVDEVQENGKAAETKDVEACATTDVIVGEEAQKHQAQSGVDEKQDIKAEHMDIDVPEPQKQEEKAKLPFQAKFRILDALSASGLRALRYAHEIPFATSVVANDMSPAAVKAIALNVKHNKLEHKITPSTGNAIANMYLAAFHTPTPGVPSEAGAHTGGKYDVVDLDPYGTAVPFLDAAIQSLNDGGLLCVTCTDAGVFASNGYVEKTFSLYGGLPIKGPHSHEAGLRLILYSIASSAAKYGIAIEPLLSLSIDFYARVWVRIRKSPADVKFLAGKTMLVHQCDAGCGAWQKQFLARHFPQDPKNPRNLNFKHIAGQSASEKTCPHCGFKTHVAGPMWGGPLHNPFFIRRILDALPSADKSTYHTTLRIEGMLTSALDELDVLPAEALTPPSTASTTAPFIPSTPAHALDPHPFFFNPSALSKVLHCQAPSEAMIKGALRHAGYVATRSHTKPGTVKTQADWPVIWEVFREWVRQKAPVKEGKVGEKMAGWRILQGIRETPACAEEKQDALRDGVKETDEEEEVAAEVEAEAPITQDTPNGTSTDSTPASQPEPKQRHQHPNRRRKSSTAGMPPPPPPDPKTLDIVFDEALGKSVTQNREGRKLMRYQLNPRANWGPMNRAKGGA